MFKEKLLLGQYYPADSPVHSLNGRSKIIAAFSYMISLFIVDNWLGWGIMTAMALLLVIASRLPFSAIIRGLKIIFVFCAFTLLMNVFFYPGHVVFSWGFISISKEGVLYGFAMSLRLLLLVLAGSLLTLTTKPLELTDAAESLLKPLRLLRVPTHEIAMMMGIALRFIPTIMEEFQRIALAQKARGASVSRGGIVRRLKAFIPMLIPLFVSAFRRAEDLAVAMEAKCYRGGAGSTKWKICPWRTGDTILVIFACALFAGAIVYRNLG